MSGERVLLVDDDPRLLAGLSRQFNDLFDCVAVTSGKAAIDCVRQAVLEGAPIAVVVCDMHMPGIDGIETLHQIHECSPTTVPIILTGDADAHTAVAAINRGSIFRFFTKPFDSSQLADGIIAGLQQHRLFLAGRRMEENEERWRLALEAVGDGVWDWTPQNGQVVYSKGWWQMLALAPIATTRSINDWLDRVHPEDTPLLADSVARLINQEDVILRCEHRLQSGDGSYRWFLARGSVLSRGPDGKALRIIGTHVDINERHRIEELLRQRTEELSLLATTDSLTGLINRRRFLDILEEERKRVERYQRPVAVVMIDIDHFKRVNDQFGHAAGDTTLQQFAQIMRNNLRKSDQLGRLGGEEFAAILPECDDVAAAVVAETLRQALEAAEITLADGHLLKITASFGVAASWNGQETGAWALRQADDALYTAKQNGRNQVIRAGTKC
ncbi:MAG TPA: diguanylate cyclase [Rhodospirillaceae bacterium]|nr:diguanylate cyclase [Rhodospirillaceae bacterium]